MFAEVTKLPRGRSIFRPAAGKIVCFDRTDHETSLYSTKMSRMKSDFSTCLRGGPAMPTRGRPTGSPAAAGPPPRPGRPSAAGRPSIRGGVCRHATRLFSVSIDSAPCDSAHDAPDMTDVEHGVAATATVKEEEEEEEEENVRGGETGLSDLPAELLLLIGAHLVRGRNGYVHAARLRCTAKQFRRDRRLEDAVTYSRTRRLPYISVDVFAHRLAMQTIFVRLHAMRNDLFYPFARSHLHSARALDYFLSTYGGWDGVRARGTKRALERTAVVERKRSLRSARGVRAAPSSA